MKASVPAEWVQVPDLPAAPVLPPLADSVPLVLLPELPLADLADSVLRALLQLPLVASVPLELEHLPLPPVASSVVPVAWA